VAVLIAHTVVKLVRKQVDSSRLSPCRQPLLGAPSLLSPSQPWDDRQPLQRTWAEFGQSRCSPHCSQVDDAKQAVLLFKTENPQYSTVDSYTSGCSDLYKLKMHFGIGSGIPRSVPLMFLFFSAFVLWMSSFYVEKWKKSLLSAKVFFEMGQHGCENIQNFMLIYTLKKNAKKNNLDKLSFQKI
jgi:hypothetical protein